MVYKCPACGCSCGYDRHDAVMDLTSHQSPLKTQNLCLEGSALLQSSAPPLSATLVTSTHRTDAANNEITNELSEACLTTDVIQGCTLDVIQGRLNMGTLPDGFVCNRMSDMILLYKLEISSGLIVVECGIILTSDFQVTCSCYNEVLPVNIYEDLLPQGKQITSISQLLNLLNRLSSSRRDHSHVKTEAESDCFDENYRAVIEDCDTKLETEETADCALSEDFITHSSLSGNYLSGGCENQSVTLCEAETYTRGREGYDPDKFYRSQRYSTRPCTKTRRKIIKTRKNKQEKSGKSNYMVEDVLEEERCDRELPDDCVAKLTDDTVADVKVEEQSGSETSDEYHSGIPLTDAERNSSQGVTGSSKRRSSNKSDPARRDKCSRCGKTFYKIDQEKRCIWCKHLVDGQFHCTQCAKTFSRAEYLKSHIRRKHEIIEKHNCTQCDKSFCVKGDLAKHIKRVHGDKKYQCDKCGYSSTNSYSLKYHISAVHLAEKHHQCQTCGFFFSQRTHLMRHIKAVHNHEKPFECSTCDMKFSQSHHRDAHWRSVHCGENSSQE